MRYLFVSDLNAYGRGYQRSIVLSKLVDNLDILTHTPLQEFGKIYRPTLFFRILWKFTIPLDSTLVNKKILELLSKNSYGWVWIDNPNTIYPWTLWYIRKKYPKTKLISFSEDDMYVRHGHSLWYRLGVSQYSYVYTTKLHNLDELKLFGASEVRLTLDSFNEEHHRPVVLSPAELKIYECDISAIGAFEQQRANTLFFLAKNGVKVTVWGSGWGHVVDWHENLIIKNKFLFGSEYVNAICASKISINFLRKINRDEITSRSMEIPACGVFMIAERTDRHLKHFIEGVEAEFFSSDIELLEKIRFYLKCPDKRSEIAQRGLIRCLSSGYSMKSQYSNIINEI